MLQYALDHDLAVAGNYQEMERRMDLVNFVDYLLINVYGDTRDWTQNNWRALRERIPAAKFRFTIWDAEFAGIRDLGGAFVLTMHPQIIGRPSRLALLDGFIAHVRRHSDVWVTTCRELTGRVD